jgi:hydrogenase maturation protease
MVEAAHQEPADAEIRILALGSPHGDDRVAWCVAERLHGERLTAQKIACPWDLIDHLHSVKKVLILDTCRSGAPVGTLIRRNEHNLEESRAGYGSTHAGSISDSLRLARVLGRRFGEAIVLAVEIDEPCSAGELSPAARGCVRKLEAEVRQTLLHWNVTH